MQGNRTPFHFEDVRENVGLRDRLFRFEVPAGRRGDHADEAPAPAARPASPLAGCATSGAFRAGEKAERRQDYDRAVLEYSRAVKDSTRTTCSTGAPSSARACGPSSEHANDGRRLAGRGLYKEALDEFRLALEPEPERRGRGRGDARRRGAAARRGPRRPPLDAVKERARERALPGPRPRRRGPASPSASSFRGREPARGLPRPSARPRASTSSSTRSSRTRRVTLDLKDVAFEQALNALGSVGPHLPPRGGRARADRSCPTRPTKRREFEQQVVKTFFLSNADLKETIDLLRIVLGRAAGRAPARSERPHHQRHPRQGRGGRAHRRHRGQAAGRGGGRGGDPRGEPRASSRSTGSRSPPASRRPTGIAGAIGAGLPTKDHHPGRQPLRQGQPRGDRRCPGVIYRLLQTDTSTRLLANPQLRTSEGQTAQARFGDQVPVPVTTFTPIATGGIAQQPITSFEYKNVGVNIDITPRVHHDGEVTLAAEARHLRGGAGGLPGPADLQQPHRHERDPAPGRRDQHPGRPHQRRRAHEPDRASRPRQHPAPRAASSRATRTRPRRPTSS